MQSCDANAMTAFDRRYFEEQATYGRSGGYRAMEGNVRRFYGLYIALAKRSVPQISAGEGKTALDLGCAFGVGVRYLCDLGYDAYGVDVSEYAIEEARRQGTAANHYAVTDGQTQIPFARLFDLVTSIHVVEHLADPRRDIAGIVLSMAPRAHLILATPNPRAKSPYRRFQKDPTHINEQPPDVWRQWLTDAGLRVHACDTFHIAPLVHRWLGLRYLRVPQWLGYDTLLVAQNITT